jgi:hypothetical protein
VSDGGEHREKSEEKLIRTDGPEEELHSSVETVLRTGD